MPKSISTIATNTKELRQPLMEKMPGHWVLARMGKRVLRPGGLELTRRLLAELAISPSDDVVEFAPGLGVTARLALAQKPKSYTAVERDPNAVAIVERYLAGKSQKCIFGTAEDTGLPDQTATVVYGEAMLSMQPATTKLRIVREAARLLKPDGHYGIHELCLVPDDVDESIRDAIQYELSDEIHVGVRPLTISEWRELLLAAGLTIVAEHTAPMHLLEPRRIVKDEGLLRHCVLPGMSPRTPRHDGACSKCEASSENINQHLAAIAIVARKSTASEP